MALNDPSLVNRQRAGATIGRIRMGETDERGLPQKLTKFRLTTKVEEAADGVAAAYGGTKSWWTAKNPADSAWQVHIDQDALLITIPPVQVLDQWWKFFQGRRCLRVCDGLTQQRSAEPCVCPKDVFERAAQGRGKDATACLPYTRLNVILPWVAGLGVWTLVSTGLWTALELEERADQLKAARERNISLTALLRLERAAGFNDNGQATQWVKPGLYIRESFAELAQLDSTAGQLRLPPPPPRLALTAGTSTLPPDTKPADPAPARPEPATAPAKPVTADWPPVAKVPAKPPAKSLARQLADKATPATNRDDLVKVIAEAKEALVLDDVVVMKDDGAEESLRDYIKYLWDKLPARPAPAPVG